MFRTIRITTLALLLGSLCQFGFALDAPAATEDCKLSYCCSDSVCGITCGDTACNTTCGSEVKEACEAACGCDMLCPGKAIEKTWSVDYRVRQMMNSNTTYQFGVPDGSWTPLSKLDWSLDSTWHGLRLEAVKEDLIVHFEWLTPIGTDITGNMIDSDWINPPGSTLDLQTSSDQRWRDGQMVDLGGRYQLVTGSFEVWPMLGFRFQRFDMFASGIDYLVPPNGPDPAFNGVDVIKFNQQYYQFYLGGQLRKEVTFMNRPVALMFQGDWAQTWGYNVDHHLVRIGGDRFTMENTQGDTIHFALGAETPLSQRFSFGLEFDYMQIRTTGSHRLYWVSQGIDQTWHNGVLTKSNQTSLTAYLRANF